MTDLDKKIKELEIVEARQLADIKEQFSVVKQSLRPSSLVKQAFNDIKGSKKIQRNALDTSVGMGAGFLARKIITFNSKNILRKLTGYALQYITTKLVTKKMPGIRGKIGERK